MVVFVIVVYLFQGASAVNPTSEGVLVFLVLLISYLIFSGRLSEIGGAGFVLRLREISRSSVSIEKVRALTVGDLMSEAKIVGKGSLDYLRQNLVPRLSYSKITSLSIKQGEPVERNALYQYLSYLTTSSDFRDVIFVDDKGKFKGWMDPALLLKLLNFYESASPLITAMNEDRVEDIPGVLTHYVMENTINRDALRKMVREKVPQLSVLDSEERFIGVVKRDDIVDSPLIQAITESN
jgi:hypothetical protein